MIKLVEEETYKEISIELDGVQIGSAEINLEKRRLGNFLIYPPYRNKGYGQQALKEMIQQYDIRSLYVDVSNDCAKHIYQKFGFVFDNWNGYKAMTRDERKDG